MLCKTGPRKCSAPGGSSILRVGLIPSSSPVVVLMTVVVVEVLLVVMVTDLSKVLAVDSVLWV